jgi:hypothetical protein
MDAQEILLDLLTALRNFEAADEGDKQADADAIDAVLDAADKLKGYRRK